MKLRRIWGTINTAGTIGSLLVAANFAVGAGVSEAKPLALRSIVWEMGRNMQIITHGISREDWELAAKTAPLIADHPQPPLIEKARILGFVGPDIAKFKVYDRQTSLAAQELHQAAMRQDGLAVMAAFQTLQSSCFDCHREFRTRFVDHFYGTARP
jgi:hypothetical protein